MRRGWRLVALGSQPRRMERHLVRSAPYGRPGACPCCKPTRPEVSVVNSAADTTETTSRNHKMGLRTRRFATPDQPIRQEVRIRQVPPGSV